MGASYATIPEAGAGTLVSDIHLSPQDARIFVDRLRSAVEQLITLRSGTGAATQAAVAAPPSGPDLAGQPAAPPPAATPAAASFWGQPAARAAAAPPPLPVVPAAAPPRPAAGVSYAAASTSSQPASSSGGAGALPSWQLCWTTEAEEHGGDPVLSMAYTPAIKGLPGGDGHAGWLVSSSRGLLNLWEASPSAGRGEPALMCMHSQGSEYAAACLEVERGTQLLLAASSDVRGRGEWLTTYSLDVEALLAPRSKYPMPHNPSSKKPGQNFLSLASLHSFGGVLAETCAASYGGAIAVWPVGSSGKPGAASAPKAIWKAHDALITCLHKGSFGLQLFSGAADGKIHMYNMREKPSAPQLVLQQQGRISGLSQVNDTSLVSCASDGRLAVWDMRNPSAGQVKFCVPDGRPITRMAVSPFADSVAVATTGSIHSVDLLDSVCQALPITSGGLKSAVAALTWNGATSEVLAAGGPGPAGTISVFKQRIPGF